MTKIHQDEWWSELEKVLFQAGDEGLTVKELSIAMKLDDDSVRKRLAAIKDTGRLITGKSYREALDGTMRLSPVYRITKQSHRKVRDA